jgi:hypothetical protein
VKSHRLFAVLVAVVVATASVGAQATPYVRLSDAAYADLDALIAAGLVRSVIVGERPYSRAAFTRFVEEATNRAAVTSTTPRVTEALGRLTERFARSLGGARWALTATEARVAIADSPDRNARTGVGTDGNLDADINPLLLDVEGRRLADGGAAILEGGAEFGSRVFAAQVTPRISLLASHTGAAGRATLVNTYGRVVLGLAALDFGRNNRSLGYGLEGGILSRNPPGFDMIRLGVDRPVRLPGFLGALGLWQASIGAANLGDGRDQPRAVLTHMRLSHRPSAYVEYGINYLNQQGGTGSPPANLAERIHDLFFFWLDRGTLQISDKVAGADIRLLFPAQRASVNVNFYTTDDRGRFTQPAGGYWEDAVWQAGLDLTGLGPEGRTDISVEWAHAGPRAHTHGQFTSGVTLGRRILGNALGPNASGVTAQLTKNMPASRLRTTAAWERYSGDDWYWALIPGGGPWDYEWYQSASNPAEIRWRLESEFTRNRGWRGLETSVRLGYEHVTRFNYGTAGRHNVVAELALRRSR